MKQFFIPENVEEIIRKVRRVENTPDEFSKNLMPHITMVECGENGTVYKLVLSGKMGVHGPYRDGAQTGEMVNGLRLLCEVNTYHPAGSGFGGGGPWAEVRMINGLLSSVHWIRASLHQVFCHIPEMLFGKELVILHEDIVVGNAWEGRYIRLPEFSAIRTNMKIFKRE